MIGLVDILEDYEAGYLDDTGETLELFAELIRTGWAWELKEPYPCTARRLIDAGYITPGGKITNRSRALTLDEGREGSPCDVEGQVMVDAFEDPLPGPVAVPNSPFFSSASV